MSQLIELAARSENGQKWLNTIENKFIAELTGKPIERKERKRTSHGIVIDWEACDSPEKLITALQNAEKLRIERERIADSAKARRLNRQARDTEQVEWKLANAARFTYAETFAIVDAGIPVELILTTNSHSLAQARKSGDIVAYFSKLVK